jgi:hypothetical protein
MRIGRTPPRARASAARRPAGPAPITTTVASGTRASIDHDGHPGLDGRGAGAQTPAVGQRLGPGVGAIMAELVATGATNHPIGPFRVDRFSGA